MTTLYIECKMGAAGDMLTAALLELFDNKTEILDSLNSLGIPDVVFTAENSEKCNINGTHVKVLINGIDEHSDHHHEHHDHHHEHHHEEHNHDEHHHNHHHHDVHNHHEHHHHSLDDIKALINSLNAPDSVKKHGIQVYEALAKAEAHVHNSTITNIHFHEVGTMDAVADVMAVCYLLYKLDVDDIIVSSIHVGSGTVHTAHGILPVPAPATAELLRNLPIYGGRIEGELCTPTGAALLRHFGKSFGDMPPMNIEKIGYGMGKKDFPIANCIRMFLCSTEDSVDQVIELNCNLDDITGEELGFALDAIYDAGAKEVFYTPVNMKKNRPGTLLTAIVSAKNKNSVVKAIFANTTTIGIREKVCNRYVLDRKIESLETPLGEVRIKKSSGYGVNRCKLEFDDLAKLAKEKGIPLSEIKAQIENGV
ncbi:hypothetical protein SAMN02910384_02673 [Pseudobutyrivibrio sp. ACV-2]|uniref:nickel pincer cofactor biosynthesis protein LarC n=1 Tax=Pseudobutyrivibrio sp. ACV-2 TaxID=1520801 RepID=UPI00089D8372|nr:nickel pincer cofactor biosynthesis protein LarC [Pseudobutyrivibrio sp. ACV-2]SEA90329.1 hypothetical protein SAMN02910384_02673 [Pseudobutyrivibrio sp. ACV-2]